MKVINIDNIEIFHFNISAYEQNIFDLSTSLSEDEILRSEKFHFKRDRNEFIICRSLLRSILSTKMDIYSKDIIFEYNSYGKPEIKTTQNVHNFQFNVSHSHDSGLIAVTKNQHVGVDIEQIKEIQNMESILKSQFSINEYNLYNLSENKKKCFFDIWAQKEALVKASGMGFSFGLSHWSVNPNHDKYFIEFKRKSFFIRKLDIDKYYSAALAIQV